VSKLSEMTPKMTQ